MNLFFCEVEIKSKSGDPVSLRDSLVLETSSDALPKTLVKWKVFFTFGSLKRL